jgi:RNA polymerase sigma factor (sigma-70 family)
VADLAAEVSDAETPDMELLRQWAEQHDEGAFAELVRRHGGWVQAQCRRCLRDAHLAEEAVQAVFFVLSRRARELNPSTRLSGWLFNAAQLTSCEVLRRERRRTHHESVSRQLRIELFLRRPKPVARSIEAELDAGMAQLSESDRQVLMLRYFEGLDVAEIATALDISREGAKKRLSRALSRLKRHLSQRGATVSTLAVAGLLLTWGRAHAAEQSVAKIVAAVSGKQVASGLSRALAESVARQLGRKVLLTSLLVGGQIAAVVAVACCFMTGKIGRSGGVPGNQNSGQISATTGGQAWSGAAHTRPPRAGAIAQSGRGESGVELSDDGIYRVGDEATPVEAAQPTAAVEMVEPKVDQTDTVAGKTAEAANDAGERPTSSGAPAGGGAAVVATTAMVPRGGYVREWDFQGPLSFMAQTRGGHGGDDSLVRALAEDPGRRERMPRRPLEQEGAGTIAGGGNPVPVTDPTGMGLDPAGAMNDPIARGVGSIPTGTTGDDGSLHADAQAMPEPGSALAMMMLAGAGLLRPRRRQRD